MEFDILKQENASNNTEENRKDQNNSELKVDDGENSSSLNTMNTEEKDHSNKSSDSKNNLLLNLTETTQSNNHSDSRSNVTELSTENDRNSTGSSTGTSGSAHGGAETLLDATQALNTTQVGATSVEDNLQMSKLNKTEANNNLTDANSTSSTESRNPDAITGELSNSTTNSGSVMLEESTRSNETAEGDESSKSSATEETTNLTNNEKEHSDKESGSADDSLVPSYAAEETTDAVQHDPIDSSDTTIPIEEKEARTDLDTLPDIRTEGDENEDAAAE
ncbi:sericin-2-like [Carica papaya]|uniref:sericin-2-like n=1 Tax=Carica papaya TaxID=3649 RepID=UPI000B8D12C7|nr:sericin-2-like [Carica papaya]